MKWLIYCEKLNKLLHISEIKHVTFVSHNCKKKRFAKSQIKELMK